MTWRDAFSMAGLEIRRRTGRAVLTILAIALAAALLSSLLTIAGTAKSRVLGQISHGGALAGITVEPNAPNPSQETLDNPVPGVSKVITANALTRIRKLPGVVSVYPIEVADVEVNPPPNSYAGIRGPVLPFPTSVVSTDLSRMGALPVTLLAGRLPARNSPIEVAVSSNYLDHLGVRRSHAREVLGTRFLATDVSAQEGVYVVRRVLLEIVGVVDQQLASGGLLAWPQVVAGIRQFSHVSGGGPIPHYGGAIVIASRLAQVASVRKGIDEIGYSSSAPVGLIISVGRYIHVVEVVLSGIGLIALAIAALGIANALLAATRERHREIGVMKAIGARDRDVLRMFLVEAAMLGLIGGVIGTGLGVAMAAAITQDANAYLHAQGLAGVALFVPLLLPVAAVAGSTVVALLAGTLPARRAARIPPRHAVDA